MRKYEVVPEIDDCVQAIFYKGVRIPRTLEGTAAEAVEAVRMANERDSLDMASSLSHAEADDFPRKDGDAQ